MSAFHRLHGACMLSKSLLLPIPEQFMPLNHLHLFCFSEGFSTCFMGLFCYYNFVGILSFPLSSYPPHTQILERSWSCLFSSMLQVRSSNQESNKVQQPTEMSESFLSGTPSGVYCGISPTWVIQQL